jgi:hypothetical protein
MPVRCGELEVPIDDGFVGCRGGHVGRWVSICCKAVSVLGLESI